MNKKYDRIIESKLEEYRSKLGSREINEYILNIYKNEELNGHKDLRELFMHIHYWINDLLDLMNFCINNRYYRAGDSRELIYWINEVSELERTFKDSPYSFYVIDEYKFIFEYVSSFLQEYLGTKIPDDFEKLELMKYEPILKLSATIEISRNDKVLSNLKEIGSGSYATVYKFKDEFLNKSFAMKKAKKGLTAKELQRFKIEFNFMAEQSSPYVLEVYRYFDDNSYIMELADQTLFDYIKVNNNRLLLEERINLANQVLKAFRHLEKQNVHHRDISLTNVLIKHYGDINVIKLSDFGLVKLKNSTLTSENTEFKGSLNDPRLRLEGFSTYNTLHETFALTLLIYYILTGKTSTVSNKDHNIKNFLTKGLSNEYTERYQSITQLSDAFKEFSNKMRNK